jgi:predicted nuclease of predicted toxin-antitoxin system
MKFKLDENFGIRCADLLRAAGHDVSTVYLQRLGGIPDPQLIEHCRKEGRALVTLDLGFSNPLRYRPSKYPGIAVVRLSREASRHEMMSAIRTFAAALAKEPFAGKLWIIESSRIRVYQQEEELVRMIFRGSRPR